MGGRIRAAWSRQRENRLPCAEQPASICGAVREIMSIYLKNLRRLGVLLIAVSILDAVLELTFYRYLMSTFLSFRKQMQSPVGICLKDGIGLAVGCLA